MDITLAGGHQLTAKPRLVLEGRSIIIGPYTSATEFDRHIAETIGSGGVAGFGESVRFDRRSLLLSSAWVHLPEQTESIVKNSNDALLKLPTRTGLPRLVDANSQLVPLEWPERLTIHPNGSHISALTGELRGNEERTRITDDFELVVSDRILGWIVYAPARYLTQGWQSAVPLAAAPPLGALLAEFLLTLTSEFATMLEENDGNAWLEIERLLRAVQVVPPSAQRQALLKALEALKETFAAP